jgi:hypothetical protein
VTNLSARSVALWAAVATALTPACHHNAAKDPDSFIGRAQAVSHHTAKAMTETKRLPGLKSYVVVDLPEKSVGPFLARKSGIAMGAYWGPSEAGPRRLVSLPMAFDGAPKEPRIVATTMADSTMLVLRATGGDPPGQTPFIAAWTELTDRGEALSVVGIAADGAPSIPPIELERTNDDIVWVEVTPQPRGELCIWAEETHANNANILAVALDPNGKPRGVPSRIARGVTAWQVVPTAAGAGLAIVSPTPVPSPAQPTTPGGGGDPKTGSTIAWLKLDGDARPIGTAAPVATSSTKVTDLDAATVHDSVVLAWTDRSQTDPDVWLAAIDAEGKPKPAHAVTARSGGARLAAIAGGKSGGVVAWEEARRRPRPNRRLHLAKIDPEGALGSEAATIDTDPSGTPEVGVLGDGFTLLTRARTCPDPLGPNDTACAASAAAPTFVRFDLALHAAQTEPIRLDEGADVATLAWGLSCEGEQCLVLAAGQESPAKVRAVELTEMPNRWRAPVPPSAGGAGPKILGVDTVQGGDLFAEVAVAATHEGTLVAALTAGGDDPGHGAQRGATVTVRPLDAKGAARGPSVVLTKRALSVGGVSIAGGPKVEGAIVAWVAREGQNAEVHLSRVDRLGRRTKDVRLTNGAGDANNVAVAWAGGGWIVAWVDTRDSNGEVYATKVDLDLNRIAREERVTNAPGDASDVTLLGQPLEATTNSGGPGGGDLWLAWADPRESPHEGFADIFVAKLSAVSAKPLVSDTRVLATAAHSRSPSLAWGDGGRPAIAWIEEAPMSAGSENSGAYGAMIGSLDDGGHLVGDVVRTHGAGDGFPTSVTIERGDGAIMRVVLARAARDDLSLDALELLPGQPGQEAAPSLLFVLDGPPSLDVSLSLVGGAVFFNDEGVDVGDGRTRRINVGWTH